MRQAEQLLPDLSAAVPAQLTSQLPPRSSLGQRKMEGSTLLVLDGFTDICSRCSFLNLRCCSDLILNNHLRLCYIGNTLGVMTCPGRPFPRGHLPSSCKPGPQKVAIAMCDTDAQLPWLSCNTGTWVPDVI